ncbi:MAG: ATP-binding protein [bacterium]
MKLSLTRRLLLVSGLVLLIFLGLAGISVDQAAHERASRALQSRLLSEVYALLGAAEENSLGQPRIPVALANPLLQQPDSGLYAEVKGRNDQYHWKSSSTVGRVLPLVTTKETGNPEFLTLSGYSLVNLAIEWETFDGKVYVYDIRVASDLSELQVESEGFRRMLWMWLGGAGALLLAIQLLLLRWGLGPLRHFSRDVARLERGELTNLDQPVPAELEGLRVNLNSLHKHSHALLERHRNKLADLAHSLKTPLAILQSSLEQNRQEELQQATRQQLPRMNEMIEYHLKQASVSGKGQTGTRIRPSVEIPSICRALQKVYREKEIQVELNIPESLVLRMDRGDFYELSGNLLENAFKYGETRVSVSATLSDEGAVLVIENDGVKLEPQQLDKLVQRGVRADQRQEGQGIGLSVVQEIVSAYQGVLTVESGQGGETTRVVVQLPAAA